MKTRFSLVKQMLQSVYVLLSIMQDRRLLASASDDGTVKIWELVCLSGQKLL